MNTTTRVNHVEIEFGAFRSSNTLRILATLQGDALPDDNFVGANPGFGKQTGTGKQGKKTSQKLAVADTEP
jgi:hypothetical protein